MQATNHITESILGYVTASGLLLQRHNRDYFWIGPTAKLYIYKISRGNLI